MIQLNPAGGKIPPRNIDHRRPGTPLTDDEIARQMRSRRRQLFVLRKMVTDREVRHEQH